MVGAAQHELKDVVGKGLRRVVDLLADVDGDEAACVGRGGELRDRCVDGIRRGRGKEVRGGLVATPAHLGPQHGLPLRHVLLKNGGGDGVNVGKVRVEGAGGAARHAHALVGRDGT